MKTLKIIMLLATALLIASLIFAVGVQNCHIWTLTAENIAFRIENYSLRCDAHSTQRENKLLRKEIDSLKGKHGR